MQKKDYRARLNRFSKALVQEGFETTLLESGVGETPYDTLLVWVGDQNTASFRLELSFIPDMEQQLNGMSILQEFVPIVDRVDGSQSASCHRLADLLNSQSPLTGFLHLEPQQMVCFRHTLLLAPEEEPATAVVVQSVWLISYLLSLFAGAIAQVARNGVTVDQALASTPFAHLFS